MVSWCGFARPAGSTATASPPHMSAAPELPKRGFGWDIDSPYAGPRGNLFPVGSYGHSGWTGTSFWIDPGSRSFIVFLSNRNHPTEAGNVIALRRRLGTLAAEAVGIQAATPPGNAIR
jgi:CubicO group peptidase (beta-lactamase class C family)